MSEKFPDENTRHLINLALRAAVTVIVGIAAFQFREINSDIRALRSEMDKAGANRFTAQEWAAQKDLIDRRNVEQSKQILENVAAIKSLRDDVTRLQNKE